MQKTVGANSNVFFPLYDAHGNMVATLTRAGTGWALSDQRSYDAWGSVRAGVANGDPSGRYCASLGHKQDDESGLIYMRARYYEPSSGRFMSEDPARDGGNWFAYCSNNPTNLADRNGMVGEDLSVRALGALLFSLGLYFACRGVADLYKSAVVLSELVEKTMAAAAASGDGLAGVLGKTFAYVGLIAGGAYEMAKMTGAAVRTIAGAQFAQLGQWMMALGDDFFDIIPESAFSNALRLFGGRFMPPALE